MNERMNSAPTAPRKSPSANGSPAPRRGRPTHVSKVEGPPCGDQRVAEAARGGAADPSAPLPPPIGPQVALWLDPALPLGGARRIAPRLRAPALEEPPRQRLQQRAAGAFGGLRGKQLKAPNRTRSSHSLYREAEPGTRGPRTLGRGPYEGRNVASWLTQGGAAPACARGRPRGASRPRVRAWLSMRGYPCTLSVSSCIKCTRGSLKRLHKSLSKFVQTCLVCWVKPMQARQSLNLSFEMDISFGSLK